MEPRWSGDSAEQRGCQRELPRPGQPASFPARDVGPEQRLQPRDHAKPSLEQQVPGPGCPSGTAAAIAGTTR